MKSRITQITIILVCICSTLGAQDITKSTLRWKVDSLRDLGTNERFAYSCNFETAGQGSIVWNQNGGFTSGMTVNSATGSWPNVQASGSVTYSIVYEDEAGTILFERTGSRCTIRLTLGDPSQPTLRHEYIVSLVTPKR